MKTNKDRIMGFRNLIKENLLLLIDGDYALLDVPNHGNIGDNLIWEGEVQFLKNNVSHKCLYSANFLNCDESRIGKAGIILFHGGGNWGDLYRECQELRNYVASKYIDKKIIIFPQTVWYNDKTLLESDCRIFENHKNVVICVRDQLSYDILKTYISEEKIRLLPDMAFFVKVPMLKSSNKKLFMMRSDSEIDRSKVYLVSDCEIKDWPTYSTNKIIEGVHIRMMKFKNKLSKALQMIPIAKCFVDPAYGINNRNNRKRYVRQGIRFFEPYETIYTTRLHGLILGILLGKQMVIVDNKYNKCSNFFNTWLTDFENISVYK